MLGGFTCSACSSATIIAGMLGSLVYVLAKGKFVGVVRSVILMAGMELLHMGLALVLSQPLEMAIAVVQVVIVPMVLTNSIGMAIFAIFVSNLLKEKKTKAERDRYQKELMEKEIRIRELEIDRLKRYSTELETKLKRLEIEIDEERAQKSVAEITDTDYFRKLKEEASEIKKKRP
jgi:LytS/YehU family sensor histidine kinase